MWPPFALLGKELSRPVPIGTYQLRYKNAIYFYGLEVNRTPKGLPEQLAIVLTYQCKLVLTVN